MLICWCFVDVDQAERVSKLYRAYIAIAQISNPLESERLAHRYMLEQSAPSPHFEEPKKLREIMRADVLTGSTRLADPPGAFLPVHRP